MSTNPAAPQFANVAVSKDKTSATVTLGQTSYPLDARVLSDLITTLMIARADISPPIPQEPPANATLSVRPGNWASRQTRLKTTCFWVSRIRVSAGSDLDFRRN